MHVCECVSVCVCASTGLVHPVHIAALTEAIIQFRFQHFTLILVLSQAIACDYFTDSFNFIGQRPSVILLS